MYMYIYNQYHELKTGCAANELCETQKQSCDYELTIKSF